jgi:hypothetical protein
LIMLVGGYVREHNIGLKGRLYLQGLLRPEEQAKLPRQRAWSQDFIRYLVNETTRARVGTSTPSAVVGYVQADTSPSSRSLERQREAIMQWCQARRLKLVAIYEDVGISNMAPLDQRRGIQEALSALTLGSVLLAFEWDRLTTHLLTAVGRQQIAFQAGAWILTVKDERQKEAALPPQMVFLKLPGALIARLDRYVEQKVIASPGKTVTRVDAAMGLLEQALAEAEAEPHVP